MRRMYSEQELSKIIKVVFEGELEEGALDESIADAVDAYLVEHPVDITALEGKTIAPAVVNATTSMSAPSGTFTSLQGGSITGDSIVENMSDYYFVIGSAEGLTLEQVYAGAVKNGNKLTLAMAINITRTDTISSDVILGSFYIPASVLAKLYPTSVGGSNLLDLRVISAWKSDNSKVDLNCYVMKITGGLVIKANGSSLATMTANDKYYMRYELTFLLSDNLPN